MSREALRSAQKRKAEHDARLNTERALKEALGQIKDFEKHVEAIKRLRESELHYPIKPKQAYSVSEATAVAVATDWHFGSRVKPEQVNGHNKFDVAIATARIQLFFERVVRMIRKEQQDVKIQNLILFLGGDMINGSIHKDTDQSDEIPRPIDQALECQALIRSGLHYLQNHAKVQITIPCCDGN